MSSSAAGWSETLEDALNAYAQDRMGGGELAQLMRQAAQTRPELPGRYVAVLDKLLQPLESSALFSEESCAFSRTDLAGSLREWVQAARILADKTGSE